VFTCSGGYPLSAAARDVMLDRPIRYLLTTRWKA
jgi:hypothetical protein